MENTRLEFKGVDDNLLVADAYGDPTSPWVIFAHGGGQTRHAWKNAAREVAKHGWYAITMDQRGHGDSAWTGPDSYSIDRYALDQKAVAAECDRPPALVGASLGGIAGLLSEGEFGPDVFSSLTLVDITPTMNQEGVERIMNFMSANMADGFATLEEAADSIAEFYPHRARPKDLSGLTKNLRLRDTGRYHWHWDPHFVHSSTQNRANRAGNFLEDCARKLKIPTHLIRGRLSDIVTEEGAKEFLEMVPHAHFTDVGDAGHMVAGDRNDIFVEAVVGFLSSNTA